MGLSKVLHEFRLLRFNAGDSGQFLHGHQGLGGV